MAEKALDTLQVLIFVKYLAQLYESIPCLFELTYDIISVAIIQITFFIDL